MRRLPSLLVNLLLAVLAVGATTWSVSAVRDTSGTKSTPSGASARVVTVAQATVTASVSADGSLDAASSATAAFETAGPVTTIYVKAGDNVAKGDLLAKVDPAAALRGLALAKADLQAANDAVSRAVAARTDTTTAGNEVVRAQLAVDIARAAVTGTDLTAPMAGTVVAVNGTIGDSSTSAATGSGSSGFVEIADLHQLQVTAGFSEADATKLKAGQAATIVWSALPEARAAGKVLAVAPSGTTSGGVVTYGVTVSIATLPAGARPGQSVTVSVVTGTAQNAISVNSAAVTLTGTHYTGTHYTVTVQHDDGTTESRQVEVGVRGTEAFQITSGLTAGEKVLLPAAGSSSSTSGDGYQQGPGGGGFTGGGPGAGTGGPP